MTHKMIQKPQKKIIQAHHLLTQHKHYTFCLFCNRVEHLNNSLCSLIINMNHPHDEQKKLIKE